MLSSDGLGIITISRANGGRAVGMVAEGTHRHQRGAAGDAVVEAGGLESLGQDQIGQGQVNNPTPVSLSALHPQRQGVAAILRCSPLGTRSGGVGWGEW